MIAAARAKGEFIRMGHQPGQRRADVAAPGYGRQIIHPRQHPVAVHGLEYAEIEGGRANAAPGQGQSDGVAGRISHLHSRFRAAFAHALQFQGLYLFNVHIRD